MGVAAFNTVRLKDDVDNFNVTKVLYDDPMVALEQSANKDTELAGKSWKGLIQLKKTIGFTQMRFYCTKKEGAGIDMITNDDLKGRAVVDYFTSNMTTRPDACGSFKSYAFKKYKRDELTKNCAQWKDGKWGREDSRMGDARLYGFVAVIPNKHNFLMGITDQGRNKFRCDGSRHTNITGGSWRIMVR